MNQSEALNLLKQFSCLETKPVSSGAEKQKLAEAVILISSLSDSQNLGVCADNMAIGLESLKSYLTANGYEYNLNGELDVPDNQPVYIKFNTERMSSMISNYSGEYRGVLMTIFAEYNREIEGTYGHLPLDLFS
jgi:hypothetical protein